MTNKKHSLPVLSIVFYVVAGILAIFTLWAAYEVIKSIATAMEGSQLDAFTVFSYFIANVMIYCVYSALMFAAGYIINELAKLKHIANDAVLQKVINQDLTNEPNIESSIKVEVTKQANSVE